MRQYNDRMEMGEPEPIESFLPDPRDLPPVYAGGTPGFDMTRELTNDPNYIPPRRDAGAMPPAPPAVAPINIPKIPNIPNIDLSNLPKFDLPTTGGRPMIPNFGNINLR
jgi:hypothetical protein